MHWVDEQTLHGCMRRTGDGGGQKEATALRWCVELQWHAETNTVAILLWGHVAMMLQAYRMCAAGIVCHLSHMCHMCHYVTPDLHPG